MPPPSSSFPFTVQEHVIEAQHIREYPRATKPGSAGALKLVLKKYTPTSNPNPGQDDLTIIGAHGSGYPKEIYEPIWEGVYQKLSQNDIRIRAIWIADAVNQNASGVLNKDTLRTDPSWFDHPRDLLYMINKFQTNIPGPIVGIGHSIGAGHLALLSLLHPRLLKTLILIEPVIVKDIFDGMGPQFIKRSSAMQHTWSSRKEAEGYLRKQYKLWDSRVFDKWLQYGIRDASSQETSSRPSSTTAVELTTPVVHEVSPYLRANFNNAQPGSGDISRPDVIGSPHASFPFYRYEPILLWKMIKHIRPSVLYLYGERSPVSTPRLRKERMGRTGRGISGSGGAPVGKVKEIVIKKTTHHLPFENVEDVSNEIAEWLGAEIKRWKEEEAQMDTSDDSIAENDVLSWGSKLNEALKIAKSMKKAKL
ncbi:Alpha/beta hydrolase family-domain-containing protein [Aspergillus venezuelensis]